MKALIVVLGLAVTGCAAGGLAAHHPVSTHPRPRSHVGAKAPAAPVSATLLLPSRTMRAGASMAGHVVIENHTGHALHAGGCISLFQVLLVNASYHPAVIWTSCAEPFTIPVGRSSYPITVDASYNHCSQGRPSPGVPRCPRHGSPPLPPGRYQAVLYQSWHLAPVPPAITMQVTSR